MVLVVDTGVDDALAIALAVRHPLIHLEAVLTSCGNVDLERVNDNTLRVLDWLGAEHVPVYSGADRPLVQPFVDAAHFHGRDGLGGAELPASGRRVLPNAVDYLVDQLTTAPGVLSVVCTGPLTNLALAVQRDPRITRKVKEVVVMGGAVQMPGNTTPTAEFNIYADPEAAGVVFAQDWPVTMVGLDVTNRVPLRAAEVERIGHSQTREAVLVREVTRHLFGVRKIEAMALHDPLAVGVAVDHSLVKCQAGPVQVELKGEYTRGQTVFDLRPRVPRPASNTRVALEVDAERFRELFFETLELAH
jgi:inosine-uridine nucleoside N-ribohydrolase